MNNTINTKVEPAKSKQSNSNKVIIGSGIGLISGAIIGAKASKLKPPTEDQVLMTMKGKEEITKKYLTPEFQAKEQYIAKLKEDKGALAAIDVKDLKDEDKTILKSIGIDTTKNKTPEELGKQIQNVISEKEKSINLLTSDIEKMAEEGAAEQVSRLNEAVDFDQKITKAYKLGLESLPAAKDVDKKVLKQEYIEFLGGSSNEQLKKAETFEDIQKMFLKEIGVEDVSKLDKESLEKAIFNKYKSQRPGNKVINNFDDLVFSPSDKKELSEMDELINIKNEKIKKITEKLNAQKSNLEDEIKKIAETIPENKVDGDFVLKSEALKGVRTEVENTMKKAVSKKWAMVAAAIGAVTGGVTAYFISKPKKGS